MHCSTSSSPRSRRRPSARPPLRNGRRIDLLVAGRGRLGRSLARAFTAAGHRCELIAARELAPSLPRAEIVFLAVGEPVLAKVAQRLLGRLPNGTAVVHVSGSMPLAALDAVRAAGHPIGSFHPFQSFPFERAPDAFHGSLIGIDASEVELADSLTQLASDIGGRPRRVPDGERALYHVAAVMSSNLLLGLVSTASGVLEAAGWTGEDALAAILPLLGGVVSNIELEGLPGALIGPIRRGDPGTISRHLAELDRRGLEEAARVYRILGMATLELALASGLDPVEGEQIRVALTGPPAATGGERE